MDETTKQRIRSLIVEAKVRIPVMEKDLEDAKRAGLTLEVRGLEQTLIDLKERLKKLEAVYG